MRNANENRLLPIWVPTFVVLVLVLCVPAVVVATLLGVEVPTPLFKVVGTLGAMLLVCIFR